MNQKDRIIAMQKQLKIAKLALERIQPGERSAYMLAGMALDEIEQIQYLKLGTREGGPA